MYATKLFKHLIEKKLNNKNKLNIPIQILTKHKHSYI